MSQSDPETNTPPAHPPEEPAIRVRFDLHGVSQGAKRAVPLALSVFSYGLVFGLLARQAGLDTGLAILMSSTVYAGAAQFVGSRHVARSAAHLDHPPHHDDRQPTPPAHGSGSFDLVPTALSAQGVCVAVSHGGRELGPDHGGVLKRPNQRGFSGGLGFRDLDRLGQFDRTGGLARRKALQIRPNGGWTSPSPPRSWACSPVSGAANGMSCLGLRQQRQPSWASAICQESGISWLVG